jgi:predicted nuclease of predicted toxin-antitoxin system
VRFLADENVPFAITDAIAATGFDTERIGGPRSGLPDPEVLAHAVEAGRILVTFDKDFGELIFLKGHRPPPAVLFIREQPASPGLIVARVMRIVGLGENELRGNFIVVAERPRFHPLPLRLVKD